MYTQHSTFAICSWTIFQDRCTSGVGRALPEPCFWLCHRAKAPIFQWELRVPLVVARHTVQEKGPFRCLDVERAYFWRNSHVFLHVLRCSQIFLCVSGNSNISWVFLRHSQLSPRFRGFSLGVSSWSSVGPFENPLTYNFPDSCPKLTLIHKLESCFSAVVF